MENCSSQSGTADLGCGPSFNCGVGMCASPFCGFHVFARLVCRPDAGRTHYLRLRLNLVPDKLLSLHCFSADNLYW